MEGHHLGAGPRLSVLWQAGEPEYHVDTVDHIASYARSLVEALRMAGWEPRRIEVGLHVAPPHIVELDVQGEVPRLDQASFAKLASVAVAACSLWAALDADAEIRLRPRLLPTTQMPIDAQPAPLVGSMALPPPESALAAAPVATVAPPPLAPASDVAAPPPSPVAAASGRSATNGLALDRWWRWRPTPKRPPDPDRPRLATRVIVALVFGGLLGLFGLPRLGAQFGAPGAAPTALPTQPPLPTNVPVVLATPISRPTVVPTDVPQATATVAAPAAPTEVPRTAATVAGSPVAATSRVLFAERFVTALEGWPHDPQGTAWFADGAYQLAAKEPGRFVAVGTPVGGPVGDITMSARFRKTGGPAGGGYGFIVCDQGPTRLDGETQNGRYIVLEVGDRGDVGIWQRDDTRWIDIMPWTHSNAVRVGQDANELSVTTQGNQLKFVVNGVEVANMTRGSLPSEGGVGVFVGGDLNEVSLEWLIVETPDALVAH
jgi:hypothetical protein